MTLHLSDPGVATSQLSHMTAPTTVAPAADSTPRAVRERSHLPMVAVVLGPVLLLNLLWFTSFSGRTLMGDDLDLLLQARSPGGYASSFLGAFTQTGADKFRPVVTAVLSILTDVFGESFTAYRNVNLALHLLNVGLVGLLGWRLAKRNWLVAATAMTLVTVSRFNVYFVLQVYGLMEGLAVLFLVAMMLFFHRFYQTKGRRPLIFANACFFLIVFTHERFIVLAPFLVVATLLGPMSFRSLRERVGWAGLPIGIALFNSVVKVYGLGIEFFTGPGGQEVDLGPGQILVFLRRALLNVVGFNTGPDYLSGRNMHSLGPLGVWLGVVFLVALAAAAVLVAVKWAREGGDRRGAARVWILAISLFGPLLVSASITFRQEFRWLYAPYVVLIVGASWALGRISPRSRTQVLATLAILISGLAVDGYYRRHVENTYFFGGLRLADSVRREIVDRPRRELTSSTIFLVTHGDPVVEGWYLRGGGFFAVYAPDADVRMISSLTAAGTAQGVRPAVLAFEVQGDVAIDVTDRLPAIHRSAGSAELER